MNQKFQPSQFEGLDWSCSNGRLAREVGCSSYTMWKARQRLGKPALHIGLPVGTKFDREIKSLAVRREDAGKLKIQRCMKRLDALPGSKNMWL